MSLNTLTIVDDSNFIRGKNFDIPNPSDTENSVDGNRATYISSNSRLESAGFMPVEIEKTNRFYLPDQEIKAHEKFISLQKYEGTVIEVNNNIFLARLVDMTSNLEDEEAEFEIEEADPDDHDLIKKGAQFYWNIGYVDRSWGQRWRASLIRFRRLPVWQKNQIEAAEKDAEKLIETLDWK